MTDTYLTVKVLIPVRKQKISNTPFVSNDKSYYNDLPFYFFIEFKIYVIRLDQPWVAFLASKHKFDFGSGCLSRGVSIV